MPIYEYHCAQCGDFEQIQKMSDPVLKICPKCQKPVEKKLSHTSFQLKGGGWYKDGYSATPPPPAPAKKSEEKK